MQRFFQTVGEVLSNVATAIQLKSKVPLMEFGISHPTLQFGSNIMMVNDIRDNRLKKLKWREHFKGSPKLTELHRTGFYLSGQLKDSNTAPEVELILVEDPYNSQIKLGLMPEETNENKFGEWIAIPVLNKPKHFIIKNIGSGKCLQHNGYGMQVKTAHEDMEDKTKWWFIHGFVDKYLAT